MEMDIRTSDGLAKEVAVFEAVEAGREVLLAAPDGTFSQVMSASKREVPVYRVQVHYRLVELPGDRMVLTGTGWKRVDSLIKQVGVEEVVIRCGTSEALPVAGIKLADRLSKRLLEQVVPLGEKTCYEFLTEPDAGYEVHGVVMKCPS